MSGLQKTTITPLLEGERVRLTAEKPETLAKYSLRWNLNSEFGRLLGSDALWPYTLKATQKWFEEQSDMMIHFGIRLKEDDRLIGFLELDGIAWQHGDTFVGLGLGEPEFWGRGYGSEALNLGLAFAFLELGLQRVTLGVFEYNSRAIRAYEKLGFQHEGRLRGFLLREGRRWDMLMMAIFRDEWLASRPQ